MIDTRKISQLDEYYLTGIDLYLQFRKHDYSYREENNIVLEEVFDEKLEQFVVKGPPIYDEIKKQDITIRLTHNGNGLHRTTSKWNVYLPEKQPLTVAGLFHEVIDFVCGIMGRYPAYYLYKMFLIYGRSDTMSFKTRGDIHLPPQVAYGDWLCKILESFYNAKQLDEKVRLKQDQMEAMDLLRSKNLEKSETLKKLFDEYKDIFL